jgi:hypothetical protein
MAAHKTLADLRTAVRDNLDESTASFWTDAQLNRFLNRAKDRVTSEVRKLKDDAFMVSRSSTDGTLTILGDSFAASGFAVTAGALTLTLPPDYAGDLKLIEVITSSYEDVTFVHRDLAHPDMRAAMAITDSLPPSVFYFDIYGERTLRFAPKSSAALDLRILYNQIQADLTGTDELTMPHPLYMAVEEYATATAMAMDRNPDAAIHEARAKQIIGEYTGVAARQIQDIELAQSFGNFY